MSQESQEEVVGRGSLGTWVREEEVLDRRRGGIKTSVHPILRPRPALCPGSQLLGSLKKVDPLPSKGRSSCTQSLVIRIAVVLAQPEELVVSEVGGSWKV